MRKKILILFGILLCVAFVISDTIHAAGQAKKQVISTNKDKLLTIAIQGQIAPEEYDLKKIKLGDLVAIKGHYDYYGRGRYEGAVTIGVCIHGWSDYAGHGPGLNPVLSALPGRIKTKIDPHANVAYYLGIRPKPRR